MSNIPGNDDELNDADFATLFALHKSEPPEELDKLILDNALLSQHDLLPQQRETFVQKYAPVIATAAVLMIAIGLTPLTMNAPETTPDLVHAPEPEPKPESTQAMVTEPTPVLPNQQADVASILEEESIASDSITNDPKTTNDTIEQETIASGSAVQESATAESTFMEPIAEADSDAVGVEEDESSDRQSEKIDSSQTAPTDNKGEEQLVANETIAESAEAEAPIDDNAKSSMTNDSVTAELSSGLELNVAENISTQIAQSADANNLAQSNEATSELADFDKGELSSNSIEITAPLNPDTQLQQNQTLQTARIKTLTIAPNTPTDNESIRLKQAQDPGLITNTEQATAQSDKANRIKTKNYRSSALLWVIEIKHLYKENETVQARAELILFRKKFPDNNNERLLPKELLDTEPD